MKRWVVAWATIAKALIKHRSIQTDGTESVLVHPGASRVASIPVFHALVLIEDRVAVRIHKCHALATLSPQLRSASRPCPPRSRSQLARIGIHIIPYTVPGIATCTVYMYRYIPYSITVIKVALQYTRIQPKVQVSIARMRMRLAAALASERLQYMYALQIRLNSKDYCRISTCLTLKSLTNLDRRVATTVCLYLV